LIALSGEQAMHGMKIRRTVGCLLIVFALLLACSQTVALSHFISAADEAQGWSFPRRYAIESSIQNYGLSAVATLSGVLVLLNSGRTAGFAALTVALFSLWLLVGRELWLHFFELPRKHPGLADKLPYFTGTLWMFTPRFLWHLILPVTVV